MITADEVIRSRQGEIFNRVQTIESELGKMELQKVQLALEKERLLMEHDILDAHTDRGHLSVTTTTTTTVRMGTKDKLSFEDTAKKIFENAGRPLQIGEIIEQLEKFGYQWSTYQGAYGYITKCTSSIAKVPQCRGMYQFMRSR